MSRILTASDRSTLIKMAAALPAGSPERKAILAGLRVAETPLEKQEFTHPKTKNKVKFKSLPKEEQEKIRSKMKGKSKSESKGKFWWGDGKEGKGALSWMQRTTGMSDDDMSKLQDAWKKNFDPKKPINELLETLKETLKKEDKRLYDGVLKAKKRNPSGTLKALQQMAKSEGKDVDDKGKGGGKGKKPGAGKGTTPTRSEMKGLGLDHKDLDKAEATIKKRLKDWDKSGPGFEKVWGADSKKKHEELLKEIQNVDQKGEPKKKEKSKAELVKDYEKAIRESDMSAEDKKKALERAKDPDFDPGEALGAMGDDEEEAMGKKASDRSRLIRLASSMPKGSEMRRAILSGLRNRR